MPRRRRDSVAFTVVVTALVLLGALVMAVVIAVSGAPRSLILATLLAALPVGPLVGCFMWLDRYEPEPRSLLVGGLLWGAFVATAAALLFQGIGLAGGATDEQSLSVLAPVTEEATKGAFLVLLLWWRRHELDGDPRRHRLCRHGRHRLRLHREHPLPRRGLQRHRRPRPGRHRGPHRHLHHPLPAEPLRAPALHRLHRHRRRARGDLAQRSWCAGWRRSAATSSR